MNKSPATILWELAKGTFKVKTSSFIVISACRDYSYTASRISVELLREMRI